MRIEVRNGFPYLGLFLWAMAGANAATVDLGVTATSLTIPPKIGLSWNWSIVATNRGPTSATGVRLQCPIPPNTTLVQSSANMGTISSTGAVLQVLVSNLSAGESLSLAFTLRPVVGGWTTNTCLLTANEPDVDASDNQSSSIDFVEPSGAMNTNETLRLAVKRMVLDSGRQKLYALERTTVTNQTVLYQLDTATLRPDVLRLLP